MAGEKKNQAPFTRVLVKAKKAVKHAPSVPAAIKLRKYGIVNPLWTVQAAKEAGLPLHLACAFLEQESGCGHNEWGHDPTIFIGGYDALHRHAYGETVTEDAYLAYKAQRGPTGRGGMQGVGPMQLTYFSFQDDADRRGGCWHPLHNMQTGFAYAVSLIQHYGLVAGVKAYNGSGPAADAYSASVRSKAAHWSSRGV